MSAVVALGSHPMQPVAVRGATRFIDAVGGVALWPFVDRQTTPPPVGPVVDCVHPTVGIEHHVVGVAQSDGPELHGPIWNQDGLILTVVATKRIRGVGAWLI